MNHPAQPAPEQPAEQTPTDADFRAACIHHMKKKSIDNRHDFNEAISDLAQDAKEQIDAAKDWAAEAEHNGDVWEERAHEMREQRDASEKRREELEAHHQRDEAMIVQRTSEVKALLNQHAALRARCERLEGALNESCVLSYISKHAADCRQENQRSGYEVYGQATFEAIQADYDRIVAALAQPEDGK